MEWLEAILKAAGLTDEGKLDVAEVMKAVNAEFPKHAVPKADFNAKVAELKSATDTIAELKKGNADNEELQKKVGEYEEKVKELNRKAEETAKGYALKEQLSKAGVVDPEYLIYKAGGIDKFSFDKENRPVGVEDAIKPYKADEALAHLFTDKPARQPYTPKGGGGNITANPFAKETFNLTQQGRMLKENPAQAKELAAAAGVTI